MDFVKNKHGTGMKRWFLAMALFFQPSSLLGAAKTLAVQDFKKLGVGFSLGAMQAGSKSSPVVVFDGVDQEEDLLKKLQTKFFGQYTVTVESSPLGKVVIIADVYSDQCPTCTRLTKENLTEVLDQSWVITFLRIPGAPLLALGTNAKALAGVMEKPQQYDGLVIPRNQRMPLTSQVSFLFNQNHVNISSWDCSSEEQRLSSLAADLRRNGFKPLAEKAQVTEGQALEQVWQRDKSVVHIAVKKQPTCVMEVFENHEK